MPTKPRSPSLELAFGLAVRQERRRRKLSQEELGFRADLHRTYIGMLERGERCPSLDTIIKLARALDTKPGALVDAAERVMGTGA